MNYGRTGRHEEGGHHQQTVRCGPFNMLEMKYTRKEDSVGVEIYEYNLQRQGSRA
jgi:hypothetical protein